MHEARLGDVVASMKNGLYKPASDYADDGMACLRMYNIDAGSIIWRDIKRMRVSEVEYAEYGLHEGDLLVNRVNSRELVGKAACIPPSLEPSVFESKNIRVRLDQTKALPKFINYQLLARGRRHFEGNAQQVVGMASISQKQLADFPIVLTDLDEQHSIVAELEKQLSRLDEAVADLKRVKANLKRYKATVLKAAVEGRLVSTEAELPRHEGRGYETGAQLLQGILESRRRQWKGKGKYKEPSGPDTTDLPDLPEGWVWATADQLSEKITDGEHISPNTLPSGVPLLSAKDVKDFGVVLEDAKYISPEDATRFRGRCDPNRGDILIVSRGATVGRACRVNVDRIFCLMGSVILIKPHKILDSNYVLFALKAGFFLTRLTVLSGSTAQQAIYIRDIRTLPLPLPPLVEQRRIVAEIDRRLSIVLEVEAEVATNLERADALRRAVLATLLRGN